VSTSSGHRIVAVFLLLLLLVAGVTLSVRTHYYPRLAYGLGIDTARSAAVVGVVAYVCALGTTWLARKKLKSSTRRNVCVVALGTLGIVALCQAPKQLSRVGFAAGNRTPDAAAVGLAITGGALALVQTMNLFWGERLLPNSIVISVLVFLNVYLFFAAW
jgi:uncharacterized membrane protein SirB2